MEKCYLTAVYENEKGLTVADVISHADVDGESTARSWALSAAARYLNLAGWNRGIRFYYYTPATWDEGDEEPLTESDIIDYLAEEALNEYERKYGADGELAQERGVWAW